MSKIKKQSESTLQSAIVYYLKFLGYFVAAVPNGGYRPYKTGKTMRREGQYKGHSDLNIYINKTVVFVEIKMAKTETTKKTYQSREQKAFQAKVEKAGYQYLIWRSIDDAEAWHKTNFKK